jgi:ankyrin repeat protein
MLLMLEHHGLGPYLNETMVLSPFRAAKQEQTGLLSALIRCNADIEATDEYGWHPIHAACYRGPAEIVHMLIAKGADRYCTTPTWNHRDDKPSSLYVGDYWECTTLNFATMGGHLNIIKSPLDLAVDVYADIHYRS